MCGIKRKNAVLIFFIIIVFLCQVHFVVKSLLFSRLFLKMSILFPRIKDALILILGKSYIRHDLVITF